MTCHSTDLGLILARHVETFEVNLMRLFYHSGHTQEDQVVVPNWSFPTNLSMNVNSLSQF